MEVIINIATFDSDGPKYFNSKIILKNINIEIIKTFLNPFL